MSKVRMKVQMKHLSNTSCALSGVLKTPKLIRRPIFCQQFKPCNVFIETCNPFDIMPGKIFMNSHYVFFILSLR